MNICLVTTFPPSRKGLAEYGFHIAHELQQNPLLSLTILADELETPEPELEDYSVIRCWRFNALSNARRILGHIRDLKPDVVWFNLGFSSYGDQPLPAFAGICIPALARMSGYYTHVTLHQVIDYVSLKDAGVRFPRTYRLAGYVATRLVLMSNSISVLLPAYRRTLREKYRGAHVHVRMHGILSSRPEYPDFRRRNGPVQRILAFGKWGTYKRLEHLLEAFALVAEAVPSAQLVIGGGDHPKTPGYVASVAQKYQDNPRIVFTGYVPENGIGEIFQTATMAVMPYSSAAGSSGVAHLAAAYGLPIVSADITDFREMAENENLAISFYDTGNSQSLAEQLIDLLQSPERQRQMAEQNFSAAMRMTMPQIVRQYLRAFDVHQRTRALEPLRRFRRLPTWVSTRSALARAVSARTAPWM
ncbi:MAG TPA: glycosyltransferase [Terriglobales bacterium]|nr:glycosyltransferase [Terriglobales bacterium]